MPNLAEILNSPVDRAAFQVYLRRDHAGGNVDFVAAAAGYRDRPTWAAAQRIFRQYVAQDARSPAIISRVNRESIQARLTAPAAFFDRAEHQALGLGRLDAGILNFARAVEAYRADRSWVRAQNIVDQYLAEGVPGRLNGGGESGEPIPEVAQAPVDLFAEAVGDAMRFMSGKVADFASSPGYLNLHTGDALAGAGAAAG